MKGLKPDRKLHLLRTANPKVLTQGFADLCIWAADRIGQLHTELSGAYAANQTLSEQLAFAQKELQALKREHYRTQIMNPTIGEPLEGDHGC